MKLRKPLWLCREYNGFEYRPSGPGRSRHQQVAKSSEQPQGQGHVKSRPSSAENDDTDGKPLQGEFVFGFSLLWFCIFSLQLVISSRSIGLLLMILAVPRVPHIELHELNTDKSRAPDAQLLELIKHSTSLYKAAMTTTYFGDLAYISEAGTWQIEPVEIIIRRSIVDYLDISTIFPRRTLQHAMFLIVLKKMRQRKYYNQPPHVARPG